MTVTDSVKAVLACTGRMQMELAEYFGMSKNSFNNKMRFNRWFAKDLAKVATFAGAKLVFILPNGQQIIVEDNSESPDE